MNFLTFTGATDGEIAFAKERGTTALIDLLRKGSAFPVTDPARLSVI